jgi:hypothetical protein
VPSASAATGSALLQQPLCVGAVGRGECERRQASGVALGPGAHLEAHVGELERCIAGVQPQQRLAVRNGRIRRGRGEHDVVDGLDH